MCNSALIIAERIRLHVFKVPLLSSAELKTRAIKLYRVKEKSHDFMNFYLLVFITHTRTAAKITNWVAY